MAIPDLTQSNPLNDALEETTEAYLNPNSLYVPPVTTPQSVIQQQQMQLDMGNLENAMFWSGSNSPLGRAIMPDSLSTGYTAGKDTLGGDVAFSKFNKKFLKDYYSRNVEGFDSFDDWTKSDSLVQGLMEGSVDIKRKGDKMYLSPAEYTDKSMKSALPRSLDMALSKWKGERVKSSPEYKFLEEYIPALKSEKGYTPPGLFSRPWGQDYTFTGDDYSDLERLPKATFKDWYDKGSSEDDEGLLGDNEINNTFEGWLSPENE